MSQLKSVIKRELGGYFATPLAYVFIVIFLLLSGFFTWYLGGSTRPSRPTCGASSTGTRGSTCS